MSHQHKNLKTSNRFYFYLLVGLVIPAWIFSLAFEKNKIEELRVKDRQLLATKAQLEKEAMRLNFFEGVSECLAKATSNEGVKKISYWQWKPDTREVTWSASLYELYGVNPSELADYDKWLTVVHPEDRKYADAICNFAAQAHTGYSMVYRIIRPSTQGGEEVVYIEEHAVPISENGIMVGVCVETTKEEYDNFNLRRALSEQSSSLMPLLRPETIFLSPRHSETVADLSQSL